jgi:hypothetical protein
MDRGSLLEVREASINPAMAPQLKTVRLDPRGSWVLGEMTVTPPPVVASTFRR